MIIIKLDRNFEQNLSKIVEILLVKIEILKTQVVITYMQNGLCIVMIVVVMIFTRFVR